MNSISKINKLIDKSDHGDLARIAYQLPQPYKRLTIISIYKRIDEYVESNIHRESFRESWLGLPFWFSATPLGKYESKKFIDYACKEKRKSR